MATKSQIKASRENAKKSTTPATEEGKARASQNSLKHRLLARDAVLPGEDPAEFDRQLAGLCREGRKSREPCSAKINPLFSPGGEAKCMRGPSVRGTGRLARGGVLEQYGEHGEQAQRSNGGPMACFDRQVVRNAG